MNRNSFQYIRDIDKLALLSWQEIRLPLGKNLRRTTEYGCNFLHAAELFEEDIKYNLLVL